MKAQRGITGIASTPVLDEGGWLRPRPGCFIPGEGEALPILLKAEWEPGPVWIGARNLCPTVTRTLDIPAHNYTDYAIPTHSFLFET
jgi:hypothetical protein